MKYEGEDFPEFDVPLGNWQVDDVVEVPDQNKKAITCTVMAKNETYRQVLVSSARGFNDLPWDYPSRAKKSP